MKNKKVLSSILVGALAVTSVFGLVGCKSEPPHTHTYVGDSYYTIKTVDSEKKVFTNRNCACGHIESSVVNNGVVATPATAQAVLDSDINNKIVLFDAGDYGSLEIRPTAETATIYKPIWNSNLDSYTADLKFDGDVLLNEEISLDEFMALYDNGAGKTASNFHHYVRNTSNVTLMGTEGANLSYLRVISAPIGSTEALNPNDPIRNIDYSTGNGDSWHYAHNNINNLTITNMNFVGRNSRVSFASYINDVTVEDIQITNNTFTGTNDSVTTAINFDKETYQIPTTRNVYKDITIKNNTITNNYQGAVLLAVENATFEGNTCSNLKHNAFAVHGHEDGKSTGYFHIKDNTISSIIASTSPSVVMERAFRFNLLDNATVNITNNKLYDCADPDNEVTKITDSTNTLFLFANNTYNDETITATGHYNKQEAIVKFVVTV